MDDRKTLWPSDYPYAKEHVFVVMTAVPASPEGFDGSERVHKRYCVSESPDAVLEHALYWHRKMWPGSEPCGLFSLADVERLGAWLDWSPRKWMVVRRAGGAVEMDRVSAGDRAEAFGRFGSVVGAVDGAWFKSLRDEMEQIRVSGAGGKSAFAFRSEEDEAEWEKVMESKRPTVADTEALLRRFGVKIENEEK